MSNTVISVENLTKRYDLGVIGTGTLSRDLNRWWARLRGAPDPYTRIGQQDHFKRIGESILALDDVSFKVAQGEALGIIGKNGAGKSTLLKILSRVTAPTSGVVKVKGRIGSLLEVGTGFHPELTGRENVYLNGAILGMRKDEVDRKFDEIVDFSGVEKFIDTPVKRYSSGMYVRLAFAVAAHLDPEILVVDEVLAVGDAEFQKKCLGKMGDVAGEGRTVLFVSHNMAAIKNLCNRCILLFEGKLLLDGNSESVVDEYITQTKGTNSINSNIYFWEDKREDTDVQFIQAELLNSYDKPSEVFTPQEPIKFRLSYKIHQKISGLRLVLQIKTTAGEIVFATTDHSERKNNQLLPGIYISECTFPSHLFNLKEYVIVLGAGNPGVKFYYKPKEILRFSVSGIGNHGSIYSDFSNWPGVVCPSIKWEIKKSEFGDKQN